MLGGRRKSMRGYNFDLKIQFYCAKLQISELVNIGSQALEIIESANESAFAIIYAAIVSALICGFWFDLMLLPMLFFQCFRADVLFYISFSLFLSLALWLYRSHLFSSIFQIELHDSDTRLSLYFPRYRFTITSITRSTH